MKKRLSYSVLSTFLLLLGLVFESKAQTMMALPTHASVYTGSARGYWFVAPTNFTITGLRVPSQAGTGLQYIHVMKCHAPFPVAFTSQSSNFTTLTYISGATNGAIQTVSIPVSAGDTIGILGTAGTSNSYATGGFISSINGFPVTLTRFGYQGNINTGAAPSYWGDVAGATSSISRVEMYYSVGPPCDTTSTPNVSGITMTNANFTWNAVTGSQGYEYAITTTATPPSSGTTIFTNSYNATGLTNGTNYWFHVRNKCASSNSSWKTKAFTTILCPPIPLANVTVSSITTISANLSWTPVTGSLGYEYSFGTSATPPASGTTQSTTTYNATGLTPGTTYYLHVRNKCTSPSNSVWTTQSFVTLPCPSAGTPLITNNVPGSVTFTWPGTSTVGVANYQWAVTPTAALPTSWNTTNGTTATVNSLISGSFYYIHVRSNCTNTQSAYTPLPFQNPFTPCAQPSTLSITAVNMHGADIKWTSSPNVINGYQYALTTSATPPTTGLTLTSDTSFTATNLVGGQTYYFYVRSHCGTNNAVPPVTNLSVWKIDSFTTPLICGAASSATITNVTSNSADIVWTKYPGIYGYEYVINSSATPPPASFSGAAINFNNLAAGNLFSGTNYYFHLRIRCDTFNYSPWSSTPFNTQNICSSTPSAPTLIGITPTTAHFSWTGVPGALQYQYSVTPTNVPDPNSNTYTSQTNAKALLLNPNSPYYFHVRAYCSPNDLSNWESVPFSTVSVSVNSISAGNGFDVIAYPNPVKDVLRIEISGEMRGKGKAILYDLSGKMLKQIELKDATGELNMSDLAQGMYLLKYRDDESAAALRVQKL